MKSKNYLIHHVIYGYGNGLLDVIKCMEITKTSHTNWGETDSFLLNVYDCNQPWFVKKNGCFGNVGECMCKRL